MASLLVGACSGGKVRAALESESVQFEERDSFSADSAFAFVERQVAFGPRVPGTPAHGECAAWLVEQLRAFGADTVMITGSDVTAFDGTVLPVKNIVARFKGAGKGRPVLLAAHYDTRPWADEDPDEAARELPFDGANDGASGVGVILEIARNIGIEPAAVPVEILLTDVEDYGSTGFDDSWCLGARQFAQTAVYDHSSRPRWGILLDMVGSRDARFSREYFSTRIAPQVVSKVWDMAGNLGLRNRFPTATGGAITDDHLPLSAVGIPTIDIIENDNPLTGSFPPTWHTRADNLENIDPATLSDVGRTVLNVIYYEK